MLETYTYPSGFKLKYVYNQRGDMSSILGFFGTYWAGLWSGSHQNQRGQWTSYGGPSLFNTNFYDDYGYPTRTVVLNLHTKAFAQDYRYGFEPATGNLSWRTDAVRGLTESFTYDDDDDGLHSRLTGWSVNGQNLAELQYQANGNISRKTDVSAAHNSYHYQHPQGKPHAVTSVSQPTPAFVSAAPEQSIEYTAFNKVKTLINSYNFGSRQDKLDITYGPDNQRKFSLLAEDQGVGMPLLTETYYLGQYETKRELPLTEQKIHYLSGPTGLFGILVKQANTEKLYYLLKDHLGSITGIADASGNILEDLSYDPWGRRRNAYDWTDYNVAPTRFDRGYTGHEHLGQFGLINMNGRVYDPFLARFLSPDPQLQSPDYSQNYNRYSYAWNNPLKYTDPSGYHVLPNQYNNNEWMMPPLKGGGGGYGSGITSDGFIIPRYYNPHAGQGVHYNYYTGNYYNNDGNIISFQDAINFYPHYTYTFSSSNTGAVAGSNVNFSTNDVTKLFNSLLPRHIYGMSYQGDGVEDNKGQGKAQQK